MTERAFAWWVGASLALHLAGMGVVATLGNPVDLSPRQAVAVEIVRVPTPPAPTPPLPPPPGVKPVVRAAPPAPAPKVAETPAPTPNLLDAPAASRETAPQVDSTLVPSAIPPTPGPAVGAPAGAGHLFAGGNLLVAPGTSDGTGSGANGPHGQGVAPSGGIGSQAAASGTGLTSLATPLGGYQITPAYPAGARRDGAQGVATLRFEVLTTGRVGQVMVKQSAGHRELDRAAVDAVKQWQFEPARRGSTPVTVWIVLPFRFFFDEF